MLRTIDFLERLLLKPKDMSLFYIALKNKLSGNFIYWNKPSTPLDFSKKAYFFNDIPDYITPEFNTTNKNSKHIAIDTYKGSMVNLSKYQNKDDYLKCNFSSDRRSKFKTYKKRLEKCFNITYKTYYGSIDKVEYDRLFALLYEMLKKRFNAIEEEHYAIGNWSLFEDNCFALINANQAVLFVIYDGDNPISISFNPILGDIAYGYLRSFDIDYSKFYLGFIDTIWEIEWCFAHDIKIFDLLKGTYSYKTRFTDSSYYFQKHIVYNSKSLTSLTSGLVKTFKIKCFYTLIKALKRVQIDIFYHKLRNRKRKTLAGQKNETKTYSILENNFSDIEKENLCKINLNSIEFSFLKKVVYDFLYTSQESINDIEVYQISTSKNTYVIKGVCKTQKIMYLC